MTDTPTTIFADGLAEANVMHGVARLTLGQAGTEGKLVPAGQLVMPLSQLPHFVTAMTSLLRQVETRLKEAQAKAAAPAEDAAEPPLPSAFSFANR